MAKIGILGGGQLGKMLFQAANRLDMDVGFMDKSELGPVAKIARNFTLGNITTFADVIKFGTEKEVISIEIEKVNTEALINLEKHGVKVYPQPDVLAIIQDKGAQKEFYQDRDLPTSGFRLVEDKEELVGLINKGDVTYPIVQKLRKDGYDGKGVQILREEEEMKDAFDAPSVIEELVAIKKELAVITCTNPAGEMVVYDPVEMVFHPTANLLMYQLAPASITKKLAASARDLAIRTTKEFGVVGLLAIEMFLTSDNRLLINEVAPRPHNSGHHTIEAAVCSQYENHLRAIGGLPLGAAKTTSKSLLINVLGSPDHTGRAIYEGYDKVLKKNHAHLHIYGKQQTSPYRKMGHITLLGEDSKKLIADYEDIMRTFRVVSA